MKKILNGFIVILLMGLVHSATAQNNFTFGVKAGVNFSTFSGSELELDSRTGFMGGISMDADLEKLPFLVESGIYYTQRGLKGEYPGVFGIRRPGNRGNAGTFKLDYVELPVMAKYVIETEGNISPNLVFGPYFAINISSKIEEGNAGGQVGGSLQPINQPYIVDISEHVRSLDAGLIIGAGAGMLLNSLDLNFQARYGIGLTSVLTGEASNGEKNRVFTLAAGITF
ncbi:MAG: PorT family protein [Balneolaceae bacterium]|nr:MAG: PorT family protein [Balneolaceae bacterium]